MNIRNFIVQTEQDKAEGRSRARILKDMLDVPCFKYCGLCNDPGDAGPTAVTESHEQDDVRELRELAANWDEAIMDHSKLNKPRIINCDMFGIRLFLIIFFISACGLWFWYLLFNQSWFIFFIFCNSFCCSMS